MKSFTIKLENLFKMNTKNDDLNFDQRKREMLIPLYQREFKWDEEKVSTLIHDVSMRDKFLGIIIFDEKENNYEIVDGQQRTTTCFLILVALYNYYKNAQKEQTSILNILKPNNAQFVLVNNSLGNFIVEKDNCLQIHIDSDKDIFYQNPAFLTAFKTIKDFFSAVDPHEVRDFKQKLLDCEFLILINDTHTNTSPIEQVFLDINEKSQLLEVEDIFKGHCFENFDEQHHNELRETWVQLKKCGMDFKEKFNYNDLSHYLYLYLLENDSICLPERLVVKGKHYLDDKNMDETQECLDGLINYGKNIMYFYENILKNDYRFCDVCKDSSNFKDTDDHIALKTMSNLILSSKAAQYQKLPFMQLINSLMSISTTGKLSITHKEFRSVVTNLFIYAQLFIMVIGKKSKKDIDISIKEALNSFDKKLLISAARKLRKNKVDEFNFKYADKFDNLSIIYSTIDNYIAKDNWLPKIYRKDNNYSLEHFVIPDKKNLQIQWKQNGQIKNLVISGINNQYKKRTINFLIIEKSLNEQLDRLDIVEKIETIKATFTKKVIPRHIEWFIAQIESMETYKKLCECKNKVFNPESVLEKYKDFLDAYFESGHETVVLTGLKDLLQESFTNGD